MKTNTINISFRSDLLSKIDNAAQEESRSRSELIREAARMYIERKSRWRSIFSLGDAATASQGLSSDDVEKEITSHRRSKNR